MKLSKIIAHFEASLVNSIDEDSTTMELDTVSTPAGNIPAGLYGFTIEQNNSSKREYVEGTISGTTVTFVKRDISPLDGTTEDASADDTRQQHRKGSSVKITNYPALLRIINALNGDVKLDPAGGIIGYTEAPAAFTDHDLVTKKYVSDNYLGVNENDTVEGDYVFNGDNVHNGQNTFNAKINAVQGLESNIPIQAADPVDSGDVATKAYVLSLVFGSTLISGLNSPEINYRQNGQIQSVHDVDNGKTYVFIYDDIDILIAINDGTNEWAIRYDADYQMSSVYKH
jgi:hypothetical protein